MAACSSQWPRVSLFKPNRDVEDRLLREESGGADITIDRKRNPEVLEDIGVGGDRTSEQPH